MSPEESRVLLRSGSSGLELLGDLATADAVVEVEELAVVEQDLGFAAVAVGPLEVRVLVVLGDGHGVMPAEDEDLHRVGGGDDAGHLVEAGAAEVDRPVVIGDRAGDADGVVIHACNRYAVGWFGAVGDERSADDRTFCRLH